MNVKTIALCAILLAGVVSANAQQTEDHQLTANFLLPGLIYEKGISENSTLAAEATIGFALIDCSGCDAQFGIYPIGRLQYRHYYNFDRRNDRGKRIAGNTGNYIAPTFAVQGGDAVIGNLDYASNLLAGAGVVYGLQRTAPRGLQFRFEVGPGYFFDEFDEGFSLFLALKLGWVVSKRKK
ncbi:MAG: hypothetical protein HRT65_12555 [Flavobacteriaceae bacterium]|nr:hypothetical protein [Flavobacteriaceae bacterium]